jgi:hypothetical protein
MSTKWFRKLDRDVWGLFSSIGFGLWIILHYAVANIYYTCDMSCHKNSSICDMDSLEQYQFLRVQVKMKNPSWSDREVAAEVEKIVSGYYDDDGEGCLYCGS